MKAELSSFPLAPPGTVKISYLEGLRGFAALQVVLVHFISAYFSTDRCGRFWYCWQQDLREIYLFFPVDGYMAVSLFFILSGFVLTKSFAKTREKPLRNIFKRWVRLQIPTFFAVALAFFLLLLCGDAFFKAAQLNGTVGWVKDFFVVPATYVSFLKEAFWVSLISGYENISVFAGFGGHFFPGFQSVDVPLWSLNIEFWGSMLIIALAWLRPKPLAHKIFLVFCFGIFFVHSLVLFLIGHVLALIEYEEFFQSPATRKTRNIAGVILVVIGVILSTWREDLFPDDLFIEFDSLFYFMAQSTFHYIGMIAAIFIFMGIFVASWLRSLFALRPLQRLGRISFALYLLHFPILLTITAVLQIHLNQFFGYRAGAISSFALGLAITFIVATFFTKWIDEPAVRFSRLIDGPTVAPAARITKPAKRAGSGR